jgi:hypothetical protein
VFRPEGLGAVGGFYGFVMLFVVGGGEGDVIFGVPVLGEDYVGEFGGEGVDGGDDCVAFFYFQGSAWAEVVLEVDDEERVRQLDCDVHHLLPFQGGTPHPLFYAKSLDAMVYGELFLQNIASKWFTAKFLLLNELDPACGRVFSVFLFYFYFTKLTITKNHLFSALFGFLSGRCDFRGLDMRFC